MQLAFSGSRRGPSRPQLATLQQTLSGLLTIARTSEPAKEPLLFRHGDCIGWDAAAHDVADALGYGIIIHPPTNPKLRAFKPALIILEPKPYLVRNRDMVDLSERWIGCPDTMTEQQTGGTWYTYRYAKQKRIGTLLILPDGSTRVEAGQYPQAWPPDA